MKTELNFWERAFLANLTRRRVLQCWDKAKNAKREDLRLDWAEEARQGEVLAELLDEGEREDARVVPLRARPNRDVDYLNELNVSPPSADGTGVAPDGRSGADSANSRSANNARGDRPASGGDSEA